MEAEALALFGDPEPAPSAALPAMPPAAEGVHWSRVKSPAKCVTCVQLLMATKGAAPIARAARFRRRAEDSDELLCHEHAQQARGVDGLPALRAPRA